MPGPLSGLLRTGLALKFSQIKLATQSYLRDRTSQATDTSHPMPLPPDYLRPRASF